MNEGVNVSFGVFYDDSERPFAVIDYDDLAHRVRKFYIEIDGEFFYFWGKSERKLNVYATRDHFKKGVKRAATRHSNPKGIVVSGRYNPASDTAANHASVVV